MAEGFEWLQFLQKPNALKFFTYINDMRLYVDTSVFGGMFDKEFANATKVFFNYVKKNNVNICISDLTQKELAKAPFHVMDFYESLVTELFDIDAPVLTLARKYILAGGLPQKCFADAQHIACATIYDFSAIISWNFKHIVNFDRNKVYNSVNITNGYHAIDIFSPLNFNQTHHDVNQ